MSVIPFYLIESISNLMARRRSSFCLAKLAPPPPHPLEGRFKLLDSQNFQVYVGQTCSKKSRDPSQYCEIKGQDQNKSTAQVFINYCVFSLKFWNFSEL